MRRGLDRLEEPAPPRNAALAGAPREGLAASHLLDLWRHFGTEWVLFRLGYALRLKTGRLRRRLPGGNWSERPFATWLADRYSKDDTTSYLWRRREQPPGFFFDPRSRAQYGKHLDSWQGGAGGAIERSRGLVEGRLCYFGAECVAAGFPPDWHRDPSTGFRTPDDRHWSRIDDFGPGDIKRIWEPNRFAFAYDLVRAFWRTGDEALAEAFWRLAEDWRRANPPQLGANWKCGQEVSLRAMAWCFGLHGFLHAEATTAERVAHLVEMLAVSGERIEANLDYALSQRNNHAVSEGTGLWTIGVLFPELAAATRFRARGREVLEWAARELIREDGSFAQQSFNYHRMMLHAFIWSLRLDELHDAELGEPTRARVAAAVRLLYQLEDAETGRLPRYGPNDGALILPLSECDPADFRPVTQAGHYLFQGRRCHPAGPWDEDLLWLYGPEALEAPLEVTPRFDLRADQGGYYTLRSSDGFAFTRCARIGERPGQADMLHVDVWWRGQNIALDPGTFSYNAPPPWDDPLARTAHHNTVTVDGLDQMQRVGRFLWLPWLCGRVRGTWQSDDGEVTYWEGEHDGYRRLAAPVTHRRGLLRLGRDGLVVLDRLESSAPHDYRLNWLLADFPHERRSGQDELVLATPRGPFHVAVGSPEAVGGFDLVRGAESPPRGWEAPSYGQRRPALSLTLDASGTNVLLWTVFGSHAARIECHDQALVLRSNAGEVRITLALEDPDSWALATAVR